MFLFFINFYYALFNGSWANLTYSDFRGYLQLGFDEIGHLVTSIFGNEVYTSFGTNFFREIEALQYCVAFVLATITMIMLIWGVYKLTKKIFGVFFMGIRR